MRALAQRVRRGSESVGGEPLGEMRRGKRVLLGVKTTDGEEDADRTAGKLEAPRIFEDEDGRMNENVEQAGGEILCVSQFTLYGDTRKGNRPSFVEAAPLDQAEHLYERVRTALEAHGGRFGARMQVELVNDGPVTLLVET